MGFCESSPQDLDRRFLLLEDFLRITMYSFSELTLQHMHLQLLIENFTKKIPMLSFDDFSKVLYLLSFPALILLEELACTPCDKHSTTPKR
jgi:hypothetical protein